MREPTPRRSKISSVRFDQQIARLPCFDDHCRRCTTTESRAARSRSPSEADRAGTDDRPPCGARPGFIAGKPEAGHLRLPPVGIEGEEVFVELRRRHRAAGQHGVDLAAMVDLVLEEMRQEIADRLGHLPVLAAVGGDATVEIGWPQPSAEIEQPAVEAGLRRGERGRVVELLEIVDDAEAAAALLQHVEVVEVDRQDVVQRFLDGREEARPLGLELAGRSASTAR